MNRPSIFNNLNPFTQLLILFSLSILSAIAFTYLSFALVKPMFDITGADSLIIKASQNPDLLKGDINALNALRFIQLLSSIGAFLIPALMFGFFKSPSGDFLKLKTKFKPVHVVLGILIFAACQPLVSLLYEWNQNLHLPASMKAVEDLIKQAEDQAEKMTQLFLTTYSWKDLIINLIVMAFIPAIAEEVLFRGVIQQVFKEWFKNIHVAIWIAAIVFSFIHFEFYGFLPRVILGAVLGYLFYWSGSLWIPIIGHALNNGAQVLLSYLYDQHYISFNINDNSALPIWVTITGTLFFAGLMYWMNKNKFTEPFENSILKTEPNESGLD